MNKPSKYKNVKTEVDGIVFDSKREAARYQELKLLERAKKITDLKRQVRIPLRVEGTLIAHWIADFTYLERRMTPHHGPGFICRWEDVKSDYTRKLPVYRLKKKLVKAIYGIDIHES